MSIELERAKLSRKPFRFVELVLDSCGLTYGTAPCTASGDDKCFNKRFTCQDPENFDSPSLDPAEGAVWLEDSTDNRNHLKAAGTTDVSDTGWLDDVVNAATATVNGTVTNVAGAGPGLGAQFGGTDSDYLSLANAAYATYAGLSVRIPFALTSYPASGITVLAGYGDVSENKWAWCVYLDSATSEVKFLHTSAASITYQTAGIAVAAGNRSITCIRNAAGDQVTLQVGSTSATFTLADTAGDHGSSPELVLGKQLPGTLFSFRFWASEEALTKVNNSVSVGGASDVVTDEDGAFSFEPDGTGVTSYISNVSGVGPGQAARFPESTTAYAYSDSAYFANQGGISSAIAMVLASKPAAAEKAIIVGYGDVSEDRWDWCLFIDGDDGKCYFGHTDSGGTLRTDAGFNITLGNVDLTFIRQDGDPTQIITYGNGGTLGYADLTNAPGDAGSSPQLVIGHNLDADIYSIHGWHSQKAISKVNSAVEIGGSVDLKSDEDWLFRFDIPAAQTVVAGTKQYIRFYDPHWDAPDFGSSVPSFPCLRDIKISPTKMEPEKGLGRRGQISIQLNDFAYHDRGIDPYVDERGYDVEANGTFLSRFFVRQKTSLQGRKIVFYSGYKTPSGEIDLSNYETRVYEIQEVSAPDDNGVVSIVGKDPLKRLDEDKAQAPQPTTTKLAADIDDSVTSFELTTPDDSPAYDQLGAGGDDSYIRVGKEVMQFTGTPDANSLTVARGQFGTTAEEHSADESVQLCRHYKSAIASDVYYDLAVNDAKVNADFINKTDWDIESESFIPRRFNALITEPTAVKKLVDELAEQTPFYTTFDEESSLIRFYALSIPDESITVLDDANNFLSDGFKAKQDNERRLSQVWVYYGQFDPTTGIKEARNYRSVFVNADLDAESITQYDQAKIRKIFARWLNADNEAGADALGQAYLVRYAETPWEIEFDLDAKDGNVKTGRIVKVTSSMIPSVDGVSETGTFQILERAVVEEGHRYRYKALEYRTDASVFNVTDHKLSIRDERYNYNLREAHDDLYGTPEDGDVVTLTIYSNGAIGSKNAAEPAFTVGDWPAGVTVNIIHNGRIQGRGGDGGKGGYRGNVHDGEDGGAGGLAMDATGTQAVTISGQGEFFGGGGGGGGGGSDEGGGGSGGGGGGGAGQDGGDGGAHGNNVAHRSGKGGSKDAAGGGGGGDDKAGNGGAGGGPAEAGSSGNSGTGGASGGAGGAPGAAITGVANLTFIDISTNDTNYVKGAVS